VEVHVKDGRLENVEGDKAVPMPAAQNLSRAVMSCPRARTAKEYFYHPERLNYPLKRAGEKGEAKWEKVLDGELPYVRWFVGGKLNASFQCVDRHVRTWRKMLLWFVPSRSYFHTT